MVSSTAGSNAHPPSSARRSGSTPASSPRTFCTWSRPTRPRTPFSELRDQAVWLARLTTITPVEAAEALDRVCAVAGEAERLGSELTTARAALGAVADRLALSWDGLTLSEIEERLIAMGDGIGRYGEWSRLSNFAALLALFDEGALEPGQAVDEFMFASAEARWEAARAALPDLDGLAQPPEFRPALPPRIRDVISDVIMDVA